MRRTRLTGIALASAALVGLGASQATANTHRAVAAAANITIDIKPALRSQPVISSFVATAGQRWCSPS